METERIDKYLLIVRDLIKHEDSIKNQRFNFLFVFNGFLFTVISFLWNKGNLPGIIIIGLVGIMSCISIRYFLVIGRKAITKFYEYSDDIKELSTNAKDFPPVSGIVEDKKCWLQPDSLLPLVMIAAWIGIVISYFIKN